MVLIGIFGAGGYAREVMPVARDSAIKVFGATGECELVFVVEPGAEEGEINGHRVVNEDDFFSFPAHQRYFNIAIADSRLREKIADSAIRRGALPMDMIATNCTRLDAVNIGEGVILSPSVILTSNIKIGKFFHANLFSYVAHDCVIGDYVTFAPGVKCNGNVIIHDHAYIGTGAIIKHGTPENPIIIGQGAVVGMGAVVTKSISPNQTVIGNPARPFVK